MVIYRAWDYSSRHKKTKGRVTPAPVGPARVSPAPVTPAKAVQDFLAIRPPRRAAIRELMEEICSAEPAARKRATDLARLVSAREPGILSHYAEVLLDVFVELHAAVAAHHPAAEWQSAGYLALAAAHNVTTQAQRTRLVQLIRPMLQADRNALRATAIEVFARMAAAEPATRPDLRTKLRPELRPKLSDELKHDPRPEPPNELREEALAMLSEIRYQGTPATSARARAMLALLQPGITYNWREDWETRKKMTAKAL